MKNAKRFLALALALVMSLSLVACGGGETEQAPEEEKAPVEEQAPAAGEEMTIKIATIHYDGSVGVRCLEAFEDHIETESDGRIQVEIYSGGVLGDWTAALDMLYNNDIQIDVLNPVSFEKQVPELALLNQYYAFDDYDHLHNFFDGAGGDCIWKSFNKIGLQGLSLLSLGFRQLYNSKQPIETMEDLKGLKIRGYSTVQMAAWAAVGVDAVSIDWNELFVSLQQKLIDGEEGAIVNFEDYSFYEVQPYFTMTDHVIGCDMAVCNLEWYESLSEEDRALVDEAADICTTYHKEHYIPENDALLEKFASEYGTQINELDPAVKAEMAEKMSAATEKEIVALTGQETFDHYMALVDAARG